MSRFAAGSEQSYSKCPCVMNINLLAYDEVVYDYVSEEKNCSVTLKSSLSFCYTFSEFLSFVEN